MFNQNARRITVFGKTGSGKTVKARNLIRSLSRVLVYDTLGQDYTDGVIIENLEDLKRYWVQCYQGNFRIIYRPLDPEDDFPTVCEMVFHAKDLTFLVEECDIFFKMGATCREFKHIIQRGRKEGIELIAVTQRPVGFGRLLTSQTNEFYIFRANEPPDVKYFKDRLGPDIADQLPGLPDYHYLHVTDSSSEPPEVKKDEFIA